LMSMVIEKCIKIKNKNKIRALFCSRQSVAKQHLCLHRFWAAAQIVPGGGRLTSIHHEPGLGLVYQPVLSGTSLE
jgi:hypothetical protein